MQISTASAGDGLPLGVVYIILGLMTEIKTPKPKILLKVFAMQLIVAILILLIFSAYVWLVQIKYDETEVGYKRALFYSLLIFGAGFSYDCAKRIIFLPQSQFISFIKHLGEAFLHLFFVLALSTVSAILLKIGHTFPGQLSFLIAVGWLWFLISSSTLAIEVASENES